MVFFKRYTFIALITNVIAFNGCEPVFDSIGNSMRIDDTVPTRMMASFSAAAYNNNLYQPYPFPVQMSCSDSEWSDSEWELVFNCKLNSWDSKVTDFWYQIYENDKAIAIAFRGTPDPDINTINNWLETLTLIFGNIHPQDAIVRNEVVRGTISKYLDIAKEKNKTIFLTGHSTGGYLAMIAYLQIQECGYEHLVGKIETFNTVGLQKKDADLLNKRGAKKIRQWYTCCDIATWASQATILGLAKLYFPASERIRVDLSAKTPTHIHSTTHENELLIDFLKNLQTNQPLIDITSFINGIIAHGYVNFPYCKIRFATTLF